jgi:hypothetical protein
VSEDRYESLLTVARPLSEDVTVQLIAGGEYSTIVQEGPGGKSRSFFRPKGSLSVSAKLTPTFSANFKAIRRVGQLDFGQFLARVFLDRENEDVGNPDLVPMQQWRFELELRRISAPMAGPGSTSSPHCSRTGWTSSRSERPANPPEISIRRRHTRSTGRAPSSSIRSGFAEPRSILSTLVQFSRIADPLLGESGRSAPSPIARSTLVTATTFPSTDWAYGGNANYTIRSWRTG